MKETLYKFSIRKHDSGGFAIVGASFESNTTNSVDFHLLNESNFEDSKFIGQNMGSKNSYAQALKQGIILALNELEINTVKVIITQLRWHLADASEPGFCFTGYQLVLKHYNKPLFQKELITWDLLDQIKSRANDLTKRST